QCAQQAEALEVGDALLKGMRGGAREPLPHGDAVERLIRDLERLQPEAGEAATPLPRATLASGDARPARGRPPVVPGYEILDGMGQGGRGVVYRARQVWLDRLVALKMILAGEQATAEQLARFRSEAKALARVPHPHIVQIFEIGEVDGEPFFALELCTGGS